MVGANPKIRILYIGNQLTKHGFNPTTIDTLSEKLTMIADVVCASSKLSIFARLADMLFSIWQHRRSTNLVLIDTYSTRAFYYAVTSGLLCRMLKVKYVPLLHGGDLPSRLSKSKILCHILFDAAQINVSPSLFLKSALEKAGYRVIHIPNFISIHDYPFRKRESVRPKLLYVRSFHSIYNPVLAVYILKSVLETYQDACLCMVGPDKDGSMGGVKEKAEELGLTSHIEFKGRLARDEWIRLSVRYDIFINTTNYDNMPVSVLEAMALGFPVISTNVGGLPYLIENEIDGILVPPNQHEEFVRWIKVLVQSPGISGALSDSARGKAESFDWSMVKEKWVKVFDDASR